MSESMGANGVGSDELFRAKGVAKYMNIGRSTVYDYVKNGWLNPIKLSTRVVVFRKSEVDQFIASRVG